MAFQVYINGRLYTAGKTLIAQAGEDLLTASLAAADWHWVVYSTVQPAGQRTADVVNGWVDDAFDIQRRRGLAANSRQVFPF